MMLRKFTLVPGFWRRRRALIFALGACLSALLPPAPAAPGSGANGVYGGYVGSSDWFRQMRESAANKAMIQSLAPTGAASQGLPADYVELVGQIQFPGGNPFPSGRLPDLRIGCTDRQADGVERAPHLDPDGTFYTLLKRGQTYTLTWMYYFGSREQFFSLSVPPDSAAQCRANIPYRAGQKPGQAVPVASATSPPQTPPGAPGTGSPAQPGTISLDRSGSGSQPGTPSQATLASSSGPGPSAASQPGATRLTTGFRWEPSIKMGELFPSYIISTATMKPPGQPFPDHFGDWHGQVGAAVKPARGNTLVRVTVSSTKLIKPSRQDARLKDANKWYWVYPTLEYDYDQLYTAHEPFPETVTVQVAVFKDASDKTPALFSRKVVVQVRSINDCPYLIKTKDKNVDIRWMFGAYVNENQRVVEEILQDALKTGIVSSFSGYQRDEAYVALQAFAIWTALQQRGIHYSSITTPSAYSDRVLSQHVRFIGDSLNYQQANCVDGSVLFASIFHKIGIDSFLVVIPRHCFMGIWLDQKKTQPFFIETTMLGSAAKTAHQFKEDSILAPLNKVSVKNPESFSLFVDAQSAAWRKHQEYATNEAVKAEMLIIDIPKCRKLGIQPLKDDYHAPAADRRTGSLRGPD
jgi:hypothetical protein